MADRIGQQVGNYRLLRLLGTGGFADVYLGRHLVLHTEAANKVLDARLSVNDLEQFLSEARTIARLIHPHIVRVLEAGVEDKTPYLGRRHHADPVCLWRAYCQRECCDLVAQWQTDRLRQR